MHFGVKVLYVILLISATLTLMVATEATSPMPFNSSLYRNDQSLTGTKPGCKNRCGNLTIPYPFGIGIECSLYDRFSVTCNTSYKPPRTFLNRTLIAYGSYIYDISNASVPKQNLEYEILSISSTEVRIRNDLAVSCNYSLENIRSRPKNPFSKIVRHNLKNQSFSLSMTANILTVIGNGYYGMYTVPEVSSGGCLSLIPSEEQHVYTPDSCISGQYCCQTPTPTPYNSASRATLFWVQLFLADDEFPQLLNDTAQFAPCSYSFLGEIDKFQFRGLDDLKKDTTLPERVKATVPLVLEWTIASTNCSQARNDTSRYACQANSKCTDIQQGPGYRCSCLPGYEGNPYLTLGCTDINECLRPDLYPCPRPGTCTNTIGRYICTCPRGSSFNGHECIKDPYPITKIALGNHSPLQNSKFLFFEESLGCFMVFLVFSFVF
ncbi:hypothetical protein Droror1_Dr00023252 [Drosera rotundifolia]